MYRLPIITKPLVATVLVFGFALGGLARAVETPPNVILIVSDDQGYGDMSCHGNPILKTPSIDQLHAESVRFTDFHVDPMCAPTRAALMTGRYSARTGVWSTLTGCYIPSRDEVTMGHAFSDAGYDTAMFGKWHLGDSFPYGAEHRGFQHVVRHGAGVIGETPDYWNNNYFDDTYFKNGEWQPFKGFCTDIWFDEAMEYIRSREGRPFFCYLATNAPHGPLNVHERYVKPYLEAGVPEKRARFFGLIANLDENLGRLMDFLDAEKLSENTILIFMGDNGTAGGVNRQRNGFPRTVSPENGFNAGMRGTKTWPYEGGHRQACFVRWPGGGIGGSLGGGRDIDGLAAHIDLLPTLAELCGLEKPDAKLDGISLAAQLTSQADACPERTLVVQNMQLVEPKKYKDFSVMTNQWRLVKTQLWDQPEAELFDITKDPGQVSDVAAAHPEIVKQLMGEYEAWWQDILPSYSHVSRLVVGSDQENPVLLTCHSWRTSSKEKSYNQRHVREGVRINDAYWPIEIEQDGRYRIELRRWPREANAALTASVPATSEAFTDPLPAGHAFPFTKARLKLQDFDETIPVNPNDKASVFEVDLKKGPTRLESWFTYDNEQTVGAYYVYVERVTPTKGKEPSAATISATPDDSRNEFYTLFRYSPVQGLGYEKGVGRRDPSTIIRVGDLYYIWYTRIAGEEVSHAKDRKPSDRRYQWDLAEIWYATSLDGVTWTEHGVAVKPGPLGAYDDRSVFTPNILVADGRYYLHYQAVKAPYGPATRNVIGMAHADSPAGPWTKLEQPILGTTPDGKYRDPVESKPNDFLKEGSWDSHKVHDPGILVRDGKYWLYYKGQRIGLHPFDSRWGVAIADHPTGPYVKSPQNPLTNSGHEIWVWPWKSGVAAMIDWAGPEKGTVQYAEDGLNFKIMAALEDIPPAGGAYIPDKFTGTKDGQGFTWGLCYTKGPGWNFLVRFDCDLRRDSQKTWPSRRYKHYGLIRDVLVNPEQFGLPSK